MKLSAATTICVLWCMMMAAMPSLAVLGYTTVTFDLTNGDTGYSSFMTELRNAVAAQATVCDLQSTRSTPVRGAEYIYVSLNISNTKWLTLGIDIINLYVWGYQDNVNYRANFLNDAPQDAKSKLFSGSANRTTRFGGNYKSLEGAARVSRSDLVLGIENLDGNIRNVYGKEVSQLNERIEAKFFLIAIQMVAEAARFKFMEEAIVSYDDTSETKQKMVAYQNNWDKISQAIHKAEDETPKCTRITPTLIISDIGYREEVNTVADIKDDIGLLKYK